MSHWKTEYLSKIKGLRSMRIYITYIFMPRSIKAKE